MARKRREYAEGQRWAFASTLAEFEHELVIGRVMPLSQLPIPGGSGMPDQYWCFVRRTDAPGAPREIEGVPLVMTADVLDRNVTDLLAEGETLPEWWENGKPPGPGEQAHRGGTGVEGSIDDALRHVATHHRLINEGKRASATAPSVDEVRRQLEPWRRQHARPAWRPITRDGDGLATASKFAGTPWLAPDEPWPACGGCGGPMQLFVQLNLDANLPDDPALSDRFGGGLLQLFYCTANQRRRPRAVPPDATADDVRKIFFTSPCRAPGGAPFEAGHLVRIVHPTGPGRPDARYTGADGPLAPKLITGWDRALDLPDGEEHEALGLTYKYDFHRHLVRVECPSLGLAFDDLPMDENVCEAVADALEGDKLAGWPSWVQGADYPKCPQCGARMRYVFQVDSNDNLDFMFGDVGRGHVTQCPSHKDVVAFGWACS